MQVQPSAPGVYSIGQLSQLFSTTRRALRHYESKGLLKPTRDGPYRLYGQREFQRLTVIVEARQVGLGIDQIQKVLDAYDPEDRGEAQIIRRFSWFGDVLLNLIRSATWRREVLSSWKRALSVRANPHHAAAPARPPAWRPLASPPRRTNGRLVMGPTPRSQANSPPPNHRPCAKTPI